MKGRRMQLTQREIIALIVLIVLTLMFICQVNVYLVEFGWYHG